MALEISRARCCGVVVGDLSFISLTYILKYIPRFLDDNGFVVLLIKPQFEVGPEHVDKGGIVRNPKLHVKAIQKVVEAARDCGLYFNNIATIPIVDVKKNIEYLACFKMVSTGMVDFKKIVEHAFENNF